MIHGGGVMNYQSNNTSQNQFDYFRASQVKPKFNLVTCTINDRYYPRIVDKHANGGTNQVSGAITPIAAYQSLITSGTGSGNDNDYGNNNLRNSDGGGNAVLVMDAQQFDHQNGKRHQRQMNQEKFKTTTNVVSFQMRHPSQQNVLSDRAQLQTALMNRRIMNRPRDKTTDLDYLRNKNHRGTVSPPPLVLPNQADSGHFPSHNPSAVVTPPPRLLDLNNYTADYGPINTGPTASPNTSAMNFSSLLLQVNASLSQNQEAHQTVQNKHLLWFQDITQPIKTTTREIKMPRSQAARLSKNSSIRNNKFGSATEQGTTARTTARKMTMPQTSSISESRQQITNRVIKEEQENEVIRVGKIELDNDYKDVFLTATGIPNREQDQLFNSQSNLKFTDRNEEQLSSRFKEMKQSLDMPSLIEKIKSRSSCNVVKSLKCKVISPKLSLIPSKQKLNTLLSDSLPEPQQNHKAFEMPKKVLRPITAEDQWSFKPLYKHLSSRSTRGQLFKEKQCQQRRQEEEGDYGIQDKKETVKEPKAFDWSTIDIPMQRVSSSKEIANRILDFKSIYIHRLGRRDKVEYNQQQKEYFTCRIRYSNLALRHLFFAFLSILSFCIRLHALFFQHSRFWGFLPYLIPGQLIWAHSQILARLDALEI